MTDDLPEGDWVPEACTLPTVDQPLRRAEFDDLFADDVIEVSRGPQRVSLALRAEPEVAARAAALAVRETGCCSFFTFTLDVGHGRVSLDIGTPPAHARVLEALAGRAEARVGTGS